MSGPPSRRCSDRCNCAGPRRSRTYSGQSGPKTCSAVANVTRCRQLTVESKICRICRRISRSNDGQMIKGGSLRCVETRPTWDNWSGWPDLNRRPLRPEQGALTYKRSVHGRLRRSQTPGRLPRPCLSASDGRPPLPFRSQNRAPPQSAAYRSPSWRSAATATRFPGMRPGVRDRPGPSVARDDGNWRRSAAARELRRRLRLKREE